MVYAHSNTSVLTGLHVISRSADHRVNMCTLATEQTSDWLMCDAWEGLQPKYQPTAIVLDHIDDEINRVIGGVATPDGA